MELTVAYSWAAFARAALQQIAFSFHHSENHATPLSFPAQVGKTAVRASL
jgi:hypothetical protein